MTDLDAKTIQKLRAKMKRLAATEWVHRHALAPRNPDSNIDHPLRKAQKGSNDVIYTTQYSGKLCLDNSSVDNIEECAAGKQQSSTQHPSTEHRMKRSRIVEAHTEDAQQWECCDLTYTDQSVLRQHMARTHTTELASHADELLSAECTRLRGEYAKLRGEKWTMPIDYQVPKGWPIVSECDYLPAKVLENVNKHSQKHSSDGTTEGESEALSKDDDSNEGIEKQRTSHTQDPLSTCSKPAAYASHKPVYVLSDNRHCIQSTASGNGTRTGESTVLLFYKYVPVPDPIALRNWYQYTCENLQMAGKVRVASEGVNVTVAGTPKNTERFVQALLSHPVTLLGAKDIKRSVASRHPSEVFDALTVNVHPEIVPMGVHSGLELNASAGGKHLSPSEFHKLVQKKLACHNTKDSRFEMDDKIPNESHFDSSTVKAYTAEELSNEGSIGDSTKPDDIVLVDCRNYYESAIGHFETSVRPNIRKFKYWPEYVDKNEDLFRNKTVALYCTGGIRCELGSAYLMKKGIAKEVVQLDGGIHRYMEKYPTGHFKGKLFVFDNRQTVISTAGGDDIEHQDTANRTNVSAASDTGSDRNEDAAGGNILSRCSRCQCLHDEYTVCENEGCSLLILVCEKCRTLAAPSKVVCCDSCAESEHGRCTCVSQRQRVPTEV